MATLTHTLLIPKIPRLQLVSIPPRNRTLHVRAQKRIEVTQKVNKRGEEGEEISVVEDPKLRLELKVKIAALECNAHKAKGKLRGHTIGVDLGDVKTGLSVSLGGYAPRPLTVSLL